MKNTSRRNVLKFLASVALAACAPVSALASTVTKPKPAGGCAYYMIAYAITFEGENPVAVSSRVDRVIMVKVLEDGRMVEVEDGTMKEKFTRGKVIVWNEEKGGLDFKELVPCCA